MFPTPYTVGWHVSSDDEPDAEGNPRGITYTPELKDGSGDPIDGSPVKVMGWAPATSTEPEFGRVEHDIDLFCSPGTVSRANDVVDLPLDRSVGRFEVVGEALDWTKGPFGFAPGVVVQLKRVTG